MTLARLDVIILSLLSAGDRTGYDVYKWLERNGTFVGYTTQPSQIYRQLTRMERLGWASVTVEERDGGPDARVYNVTEQGITELDEWIDSPYHPAARPLDPDFQVRLLFSARRGPEKMLELVRTELAYRRTHEEYRKDVDIDLVPRGSTLEEREWWRESSLLQGERGHYMVQTLMAWLESAEARLVSYISAGRGSTV